MMHYKTQAEVAAMCARLKALRDAGKRDAMREALKGWDRHDVERVELESFFTPGKTLFLEF